MNKKSEVPKQLTKREKALALLQNINEEVKVLNHLLKKMQVDIASGEHPDIVQALETLRKTDFFREWIKQQDKHSAEAMAIIERAADALRKKEGVKDPESVEDTVAAINNATAMLKT